MPGIDSFTKLCLHCDGTNGATVFTDASTASPKGTGTANGNVHVDTSQSKFGGASAVFDGSGDFISFADHADYDLGSGDWTIDFWFRFNSHASGYQTWIGQANIGASSNMGWSCEFNDYVGSPLFTYGTTGTNLLNFTAGIASASWTDATWYHLAFVRTGNIGRIFRNGVQVGSDYNFTGTTIFNSSALLRIGTRDSGNDFNGWLDEIRVSKGIARWTANFTPPTAPYDTSILYTDTPSGGIRFGGSVVLSPTYTTSPSGGIALGGSCSSSIVLGPTYTDTPSGGIRFGGSIALDTTWPTYTPAGGLVLGGSTGYGKVYDDAPSGGIVFGGSITSDRAVSYTRTGGLTLGGSCVSDLTVASGYYDTPSGGIVLGGSVQVAYSPTNAPTGGIKFGGSVVLARTVAYSPSGGIALGGTCTSSLGLAQNYAPSGGLVLGGTATYSYSYIITRTGGLVLGGSTVTTAGGTRTSIVGTFLVGQRYVGEFGLILGKAKIRLKPKTYRVFVSATVPIYVHIGKPKLKLKAKPLVFDFSSKITIQKSRIKLRGKTYSPVQPTKVLIGKPRILVKPKPYALALTQRMIVGKAKLLLNGKQIHRVGQAGLVPSPPQTMILQPTVVYECPDLVPTEPESTLLTPTSVVTI